MNCNITLAKSHEARLIIMIIIIILKKSHPAQVTSELERDLGMLAWTLQPALNAKLTRVLCSTTGPDAIN